MASSGDKNPQSNDLKQIVCASKQDMTEMQTNLAKLRGLSEDDKGENALLRSRIDEQSKLIMILKQRSDEGIVTIKTLERINQELQDFRDNAEHELRMQMKKCNMLDSRFNDLAHNHQELIKFKDEYKRQNRELREENARLVEENARLFSKAIEERDERINELDAFVENLQTKHTALEAKYKELERTSKSTENNHKTQVQDLQQKLQDYENKLKDLNRRLEDQVTSRQSASQETQTKIEQLTKEKAELLDLAMSRGKLIQDKQSENKALQQKIVDMEKQVRNMEAKFEREAAAVNANVQVKKLRAEMEDADENQRRIIREFEAFKKHSSSLLEKEKELNAKLRHLMG